MIVRGVSRSLTPWYNPYLNRKSRVEVVEIESGLSRNRGSGSQRNLERVEESSLTLPRKTENPNRIISKTRKTKIEPYQSRVDFARISITSEWTLTLFAQLYEKFIANSHLPILFPLRIQLKISKRSIACFVKMKNHSEWLDMISGSEFDRATTKFLRGF